MITFDIHTPMSGNEADGTGHAVMPSLIEEERGKVERWLRRVAAGYGFRVGDLHYLFCTDAQELAVNRQFLSHDYYTDIITFDYSTPSVLSGDIFISVDTVRSNAEGLGTGFNNELKRILVHGLLHLTGQDDKTPETKMQMTAKEELALAQY